MNNMEKKKSGSPAKNAIHKNKKSKILPKWGKKKQKNIELKIKYDLTPLQSAGGSSQTNEKKPEAIKTPLPNAAAPGHFEVNMVNGEDYNPRDINGLTDFQLASSSGPSENKHSSDNTHLQKSHSNGGNKSHGQF